MIRQKKSNREEHLAPKVAVGYKACHQQLPRENRSKRLNAVNPAVAFLRQKTSSLIGALSVGTLRPLLWRRLVSVAGGAPNRPQTG